MNWVDWVDAISKIVSTAALVAAGTWAYYKFVRGRTFAKRAELEVTGEAFDQAGFGLQALRARVRMRNTGAATIPLRAKGVWVYGLNSNSDTRADWGDHLAAVTVLENHGWIEAQETISDDVLIPFRREQGRHPVYKIEFRAYERRKPGKGGLRWTAAAIVPVRPSGTTPESNAD